MTKDLKTPEQMAEEWVSKNTTGSETYEHGLRNGFLAGYQAAMNSPEKQDSCEHILDMEKMVDADKVMDFNKGNFAKMEKVNMKFAYDSFPVTDKQAQDVKQIRENFSLLTDVLTQLVPNGRYLSIVQTKLEEACMFAVKGITHQAGDYGNLQNKA